MNTQEMTELQRAGLALKTMRQRLREVGEQAHEPIAIIGMSCRYPGSVDDIAGYWSFLARGGDAVREIPDSRGWDKEELYYPETGTPGKICSFAGGWLEGIELFDADFFGIAPGEAMSIDPQHRLLLETSWQALEEAGETVDRQTGAKVGVFVGITSVDYALHTIRSGRPELLSGSFTTGVALNAAAGRIAYTFGFNGPCFAVDTACSSSLTAVHLAVRSLRARESNMALAAGVNVLLYPGNHASMCEARVVSPSGHCHSFDASADGLVRSEGCGVLLLKRLSEALADGNHIHAVIRGTAINQDGASSSLAAPNGHSQEAVMRDALDDAGLKASDVDYVEAHGTGTPVGDPIELGSLQAVYGKERTYREPLWIGSVKSNLGHMESASGTASLIKLALSLRKQQMVRQLHCETPTPEIDWQNCGLRVCTSDRSWERTARPRRGGVNSFGLSGTNVHMVLEEAPATPAPDESLRSHHALLLSAATSSSLDTATTRLVEYLQHQPEVSLADVAYTLQTGRASLAWRRMIVCEGRQDAIDGLSSLDPNRVATCQAGRNQSRPLVFMFPGTGEHYVRMGWDLYRQERIFRQAFDQCSELAGTDLGCDLTDLLYGAGEELDECTPEANDSTFARMVRGGGSSSRLSRTLYAHTTLFAVEYSLARMLLAWGLKPQLMIGYSLGEHVAACIAGVMSLRDALRVVMGRAKIIEQQPKGGMLSVIAGPDELEKFLSDGVWLAAIAGPQFCVLAGHNERLRHCVTLLSEAGIACRDVGVEHAFHTPLLSGIEADFCKLLDSVELKAPEIPVISNLTGALLTNQQACDPNYWYRHTVSPVQFSAGIALACKSKERVLIEIGPGQALCSLAQRQPGVTDTQITVPTVRGRYEQRSDVAYLQGSLAKLWAHGVKVNWQETHSGEKRRKLSLPTYNFERQRHWIDSYGGGLFLNAQEAESVVKSPIKRWFAVPEWRRCTLASATTESAIGEGPWLILGDGNELGSTMVRALRSAKRTVVYVQAAREFSVVDRTQLTMDPAQVEHYALLSEALRTQGISIRNVIDLWPTESREESSIGGMQHRLERGFYSAMWLLQALGEDTNEEGLAIAVVTTGAQSVIGDELCSPEYGAIDGLLRSARQEITGLRCCGIDIPSAASVGGTAKLYAEMILREFSVGMQDSSVAFRGLTRWIREFAPVVIDPPDSADVPLRQGGVYLVTGGLGGVGRILVTYLAKQWAAKIAIVTRTAPPPESDWDQILASGRSGDTDLERVSLLRTLAEQGIEIQVVLADVANRDSLATAVDSIIAKFGTINGVFHCAGTPGAGLVMSKRREDCETVFSAKIAGSLNLAELCEVHRPDFIVYFSSVLAFHGGIGQSDYSGANSFLDALSHSQRRRGVKAISINWGTWRYDGWQDKLTAGIPAVQEFFRERRVRFGMDADEGMDALCRAMRFGAPQIVVSTIPALELVRVHQKLHLSTIEDRFTAQPQRQRASRMLTEYAPPCSATQTVVQEIWTQILGVEQIGIYDDFFDLGGHSLLGTKIVSEVQRRFGFAVSLRSLLGAPSVEKFAAVLEERLIQEVGDVTE